MLLSRTNTNIKDLVGNIFYQYFQEYAKTYSHQKEVKEKLVCQTAISEAYHRLYCTYRSFWCGFDEDPWKGCNIGLFYLQNEKIRTAKKLSKKWDISICLKVGVIFLADTDFPFFKLSVAHTVFEDTA